MNSRERMIRAIEHTGPDRIPITHCTLPGAFLRYGAALERLYARYPADAISVGGATFGEYGPEIGAPSADAWGALWVRYTSEHKGQVVGYPLREWGDLRRLDPPDTASPALLQRMAQAIAENDGLRYTLADGDTLWQRMFYLRGYQALLEDLLLARERCAELRDLIMRVMLRRVGALCRMPGLDGVHFRDDWGTQEALMISPRLWREFFRPAYARLFALVRDAGKHVWFHSDGAISAIIPDLIEIGAQVLNPQVNLIGRERLVELTGGKICIEGDIDRQFALPFGSPDDVRAAVRQDVAVLGRFNGGYIGRGEVASDVPLANAEAMLDEMSKSRS